MYLNDSFIQFISEAGYDARLFLIGIFLFAQLVSGWMLPVTLRRLPGLWWLVMMLCRKLETKLNREKRTRTARRVRGALVFFVLLFASYIAGHSVSLFGSWQWLVYLLLFTLSVSVVFPIRVMRHLYKALQAEDLKRARYILAPFIRQNLAQADEYTLTRAGTVLTAWAVNCLLVGPVFWFLLLGMPGLFMYVCAAAMNREIGHEDARHSDFGWTAARVDDILNFIPARLTGLLFLCAGLFSMRGKPFTAAGIMMKQAKKHEDLNEGWPVAALAGLLDVALSAGVGNQDWIGGPEASAKMPSASLKKLLILLFLTFFVILLILVLCLMMHFAIA